MTILEMHVTVEAQLAQVNAFRNRKFFPEEKDAALNRQIRAFSAKRAANYLNKEIESLEEVSTLIKQEEIIASVERTTSKYTEYSIPMPPDYGYLLWPIFRGRDDCGDVAAALQLQNNSTTRYKLQIPSTSKSSPSYYATYTITINGTEVFNITNPAKGGKTGWTGVADKDSFLAYLEYILWVLNDNGVYAHRSKTSVARGWLYSDQPFTINIDGTAFTAVAETTEWDNYSTHEREYYGSIGDPYAMDELLNTPFVGMHKRKLLYTMKMPHQLRVFVPTGVIVTDALINYLRKPRVVNVTLGSDCDLPDTGKVHDTICMAAVRDIMGDTADERYPIKAQQESQMFNNLS